MNNFDLKKFLIENKLTYNSRLREEDEELEEPLEAPEEDEELEEPLETPEEEEEKDKYEGLSDIEKVALAIVTGDGPREALNGEHNITNAWWEFIEKPRYLEKADHVAYTNYTDDGIEDQLGDVYRDENWPLLTNFKKYNRLMNIADEYFNLEDFDIDDEINYWADEVEYDLDDVDPDDFRDFIKKNIKAIEEKVKQFANKEAQKYHPDNDKELQRHFNILDDLNDKFDLRNKEDVKRMEKYVKDGGLDKFNIE